MIILRQQMRSKPERTDEVLAALAAISSWCASHAGRHQPRHRTRPPRARFFRRDRGLRGRRGARKTGVGSRGPQGDGDVFGALRGAARSNDLRRVARPDARLSSAGPPWHLDATSWITRGLRRSNATPVRGDRVGIDGCCSGSQASESLIGRMKG
jgi:hypothetical protein